MTTAEEAVTQPVRVNLVFNDRPVRVPYGVTLFDAASWNGIAIDSTCGGHGDQARFEFLVGHRVAARPDGSQLGALVLNRDEWGASWIAAHRAAQRAAEQAAAQAQGAT